MADIDDIMANGVTEAIRPIWNRYDTEGEGKLDKANIIKVLNDFAKEDYFGTGMAEDIDPEEYEQLYNEFDTENVGSLEFAQMVPFFFKVSGLDDMWGTHFRANVLSD